VSQPVIAKGVAASAPQPAATMWPVGYENCFTRRPLTRHIVKVMNFHRAENYQ
jgi:hypothetical protein